MLGIAVTACAAERDRAVACDDCLGVHPRGILDEQSDAFHGKELARRGWDLMLCASCHGEDFRGGTSGKACTGCHAEGPTACTTCHAMPPLTGAHVRHETASVACAECHLVPARWDDPGHVLEDPSPGVAEVVLGARAQLTPVPADRGGPPSYDGGACGNVYCHGDTLRAAGGLATRPRWDQPPAGGCDRCHGAPPPSHAQSACTSCHPPGAPHIDGVTQIGTTAGCDGCHGSAASSAPPRDLAGNTSTTMLGVGAHQVHLAVPSGLRGPIPCATCHLVPTTVTAAGHLDSALPAEVDASLGWDRTAGTCATAWCHGPGRPVWTQTGNVACGTCHGVPPATASHTPLMPLTSCATCHPDSVTSSGSILLVPGPNGVTSEHADGDVDAL